MRNPTKVMRLLRSLPKRSLISKTFLLLLTVGLLVTFSAGCAPSATQTPEIIEVTRVVAGTPEIHVITATPGAEVSAAGEAEVRIGIVLPLTGPMGDAGRHDLEAMLVAIDIVNEKHDVDLPLASTEGLPNLDGAKLVPIIADNQGLPDKALADTERLITENNVVAIGSTYSSSLAFTVSEAAERYGIPQLAGDPSAYGLTDRGFKWFFRSGPTDRLAIDTILTFAEAARDDRELPLKTLGIIHDDSIWATESTEYIQNVATDHGFEVVEVIPIKALATSLNAEVLRLKSSNPDILIPLIYAADTVLLTRTMEELGYVPPMIVGNAGGVMTDEYLELGPMAYGTLNRQEFDPAIGELKPSVKYVNDLYKERTGDDMVSYCAKAFTGTLALAEAINNAGSTDPKAIRQAILALDIPPEQTIVTWGVRFDEATGQNVLASTMLQQIQKVDGEYKWVTVWPWNVAPYDLVFPIPGWAVRP